MKKIGKMFLAVLAVALMNPFAGSAATIPETLEKADQLMAEVIAETGLKKGDPNLLVLTNAGYGTINGESTEAFLDSARDKTGCSPGIRSLLAIHTSVEEPLWCSVYRKHTGKVVFFKWTGEDFHRQTMDASPASILSPEGWKKAASGLIGGRIFSVISISLTWAADPPWPLLHAATFHDHFCPGLNSGYIAGLHLIEKMPLQAGDRYVFVTAPGKCAADALQVMFNTTAGKSSGYSMAMDGKTLAEYSSGKIRPATIAMRVNKKADRCEGVVLGFDWGKAYEVIGVKPGEMAPEGGPADPMFWIARVKMSRGLAGLPKPQLLEYIVELKSFSGKASLADRIAAGNPYSVILNQ
ncbi:MAG TPA: hypothetical protein ENN79_03120 [Desulfobacteraceae bacterium]|nr:hypothetical protein [Desulfobacteraceae bacterium]